MFKANILTVYPEMFPSFLQYSLAGKARDNGKWDMNVINIRDFTTDNYHSVDDTPYGGGAGMIMKAEVLGAALDTVADTSQKMIYLSPKGKPLNQQKVREIASKDEVSILCGRFEGIDQRVIDFYDLEEISIGDYVLSGGEPAALVLLDAVIRLLDGVMGSSESVKEESFEGDLLEYPQYTKPREWRGLSVPEVLFSGNHQAVKDWQKCMAEEITFNRRPDIWEKYLANKS